MTIDIGYYWHWYCIGGEPRVFLRITDVCYVGEETP